MWQIGKTRLKTNFASLLQSLKDDWNVVGFKNCDKVNNIYYHSLPPQKDTSLI